MAVGVDEAVRIHEAEVFRLVVGRASRGDGLRDKFVDLLTALATEVDQDFHRLGGIADGLGSEFAELGMRAEHDENRLADDDARGRIAAELRVERVAQRLEKGHRLRQIGDGQAEEDLLVHGR